MATPSARSSKNPEGPQVPYSPATADALVFLAVGGPPRPDPLRRLVRAGRLDLGAWLREAAAAGRADHLALAIELRAPGSFAVEDAEEAIAVAAHEGHAQALDLLFDRLGSPLDILSHAFSQVAAGAGSEGCLNVCCNRLRACGHPNKPLFLEPPLVLAAGRPTAALLLAIQKLQQELGEAELPPPVEYQAMRHATLVMKAAQAGSVACLEVLQKMGFPISENAVRAAEAAGHAACAQLLRGWRDRAPHAS